MVYHIRKAERGDHAALVEIEKACLDVARYKWVMSPRAVRHHITNCHSTFLVCEQIGSSPAVVGYALALARANSDSLRFASLAVLQAYRGLGLGERLIDSVEAYAREHQYRLLVLDVRGDDDVLLRRYLALGYTRRKRIAHYHPDGGDALRLAKALGPTARQGTWRGEAHATRPRSAEM